MSAPRRPPRPHPRRGEIYLVRLPGHPGDSKNRPALVVSLDIHNRLAHDVIVIPLSTTLRPAPTHVELPAGEGGGPFAGMISPSLLQQIENAIQRAIGIPVF